MCVRVAPSGAALFLHLFNFSVDILNPPHIVGGIINNSTMKIHYSAVVLDKASQDKLLSFVGVPSGWKAIAHHMTIIYGQGLPESIKADLGKNVELRVTHIGKSDKAIAVKVEGYFSKNFIPHVTVAVNVNEGGKPVDSNRIEDWAYVGDTLTLYGLVEEVGY